MQETVKGVLANDNTSIIYANNKEVRISCHSFDKKLYLLSTIAIKNIHWMFRCLTIQGFHKKRFNVDAGGVISLLLHLPIWNREVLDCQNIDTIDLNKTLNENSSDLLAYKKLLHRTKWKVKYWYTSLPSSWLLVSLLVALYSTHPQCT